MSLQEFFFVQRLPTAVPSGKHTAFASPNSVATDLGAVHPDDDDGKGGGLAALPASVLPVAAAELPAAELPAAELPAAELPAEDAPSECAHMKSPVLGAHSAAAVGKAWVGIAVLKVARLAASAAETFRMELAAMDSVQAASMGVPPKPSRATLGGHYPNSAGEFGGVRHYLFW